MIRKGFKKIYVPLKVYTSMEVGTISEPVQEYDAVLGQYYPDRTITNCELVLTPIVGYTDPNDGSENTNAASMLSDGHWYRIDNTSGNTLDSTTEIASGSDYVIDTLAGSPTYGYIKIRENVDPGNPVTYVFRATLSHPNGDILPVELRYLSRSRAVATVPVLRLDNATKSIYNPFSSEDVISFHPVLTPAVAGASFKWESYHGSSWGPINSTMLDWAVTPDADGVKVRRSLMPDRIDLRCTVEYTTGDGKTKSDSVVATIVRRLPQPLHYDIAQIMDIRDNVKSVAPKAIVSLGGSIIDDPLDELDIIWYNSADKEVARGMNPVIPLSALGNDLDIGLDVVDKGGWKALTDSDGTFLTDSDGTLLLVK